MSMDKPKLLPKHKVPFLKPKSNSTYCTSRMQRWNASSQLLTPSERWHDWKIKRGPVITPSLYSTTRVLNRKVVTRTQQSSIGLAHRN